MLSTQPLHSQLGHLWLLTHPLPREAEDFPRGGNHSKHVTLLKDLAWLQPVYSDPKFVFMHIKTEKNFAFGEDFHKKHRAAVTLISSHESENLNNCSLKKCISKHGYTSKLLPEKNMVTLQNCSLKKCKLPPQKYEHKQERILTEKDK